MSSSYFTEEHELFRQSLRAFLDKEVRKSQSAWGFLKDGEEERMVQILAQDLASGKWDEKHSKYRTMSQFTGALRLVVSN